jgi:hypothetical protein
MISPKHCPHCLKRIPLKKRIRTRCPFCFRAFRRRSGLEDRTAIGLWLEDRSTSFWFFMFLVIIVLYAMIAQACGNADLLNFIDHRPVWFTISLFWMAMFTAVINRMFLPLLLGAPRIIRRERVMIKQYRRLTIIGLLLGIPLVLAFLGTDGWQRAFPGSVFLFFVPVTLMWSYQALTLTDEEYEDERAWAFLHEIGAPDKLEHRHRAYFTLIGLPISALIFYFFMTHPFLARMLQESEASGIIAMLKQLVHRATGRG